MIERTLPMLSLLLFANAAIAADTVPVALSVAEHEAATAHVMEGLGSDPQRLEVFLRAMPKGGDLHMHLAGAVYAESMIGWAAADHLCVDRVRLNLVNPPCRAPDQVLVEDVIKDEGFYHRLIDIMSMRDFVPGEESGHDHFFEGFRHYQVLNLTHSGDMVAEVAAQAAAEHVQYLEIMVSPQMLSAMDAGKHTGAAKEDFQGLSRELAEPIETILARANSDIAATESQKNLALKCGTPEASPGCQVTIRYLAQVLRSQLPAQVFAQDLLAFRLAESNPLVVGINLVQPEDDRRILTDYALQMRQLRWLHEQHPKVKQTLHAGELALGLVPPSDLRFHIKQAVEVAGAVRIGHGVDIAHEDDAAELLQRMAHDHVMVEINLTSNAQILGVQGAEHPFMTYRAYGVPVALSTDDQGESRIDLTHEYVRAVATYHLSYETVKELSRNSVEYSFLSGPSLWRSVAPYRMLDACAADLEARGCVAFLKTSEKARVQVSLETAYRAFEGAVAGGSMRAGG
jgi:adenosine deaminase